MNIKDRILLSQKNRAKVAVEMPEWADENGDASTIYVTEMTAGESSAILAILEGDEGESGINALIETIILKTQDESGALLFTQDDKEMLLAEKATTLQKIGDAVSNLTTDVETASKN